MDKTRPFEAWSDRFVQDGRDYHKLTLELLDKDAPPPVQPEKLDFRKLRQIIIWKDRPYFIQEGWLFDRRTGEQVKI